MIEKASLEFRAQWCSSSPDPDTSERYRDTPVSIAVFLQKDRLTQNDYLRKMILK